MRRRYFFERKHILTIHQLLISDTDITDQRRLSTIQTSRMYHFHTSYFYDLFNSSLFLFSSSFVFLVLSWTVAYSNALPNWANIVMSTDTQYIYAIASQAIIFRSSDYGVTWITALEASTAWGIATSADGKYVYFARGLLSSPVTIDRSTDYGITWSTSNPDVEPRG